MKKRILYLYTIVITAMFVASCSNKYEVFNDKNAFVAFDNRTLAVSENAGTIEVPITLASVAGVSTTIKCESVDGTAVSGVNYVIDGDGSVSFDANSRTASLKVKIIELKDVFTGDLKFTIKFSNTGSVNAGEVNTVSITIKDLDHPLAAILGTYTVAGESFWDGPTEWNMEIIKDPVDINKVWFFNIANMGSWADDDTMYYGIVNADKTTITVPMGQESVYKYSNGEGLVLYGAKFTAGVPSARLDEGNFEFSIENNGKVIVFDQPDMGMWVRIPTAGNISITSPGFIAVKK